MSPGQIAAAAVRRHLHTLLDSGLDDFGEFARHVERFLDRR
jgi:hypothetical protein